MDLVVNHMLETLIVGGTEEDLSLQRSARMSVVQALVAVPLVPSLVCNMCMYVC